MNRHKLNFYPGEWLTQGQHTGLETCKPLPGPGHRVPGLGTWALAAQAPWEKAPSLKVTRQLRLVHTPSGENQDLWPLSVRCHSLQDFLPGGLPGIGVPGSQAPAASTIRISPATGIFASLLAETTEGNPATTQAITSKKLECGGCHKDAGSYPRLLFSLSL